MGLGISDEVLEKILAVPFEFNVSNEQCFSDISKKHYSEESISINFKQHNERTLNHSHGTSEDKKYSNSYLLCSICNQTIILKSIINDFKSSEIQILIQRIIDHFNNYVAELNLTTELEAPVEINKKAQIYLFDGITRYVYYYLTHNCVSKQQLRNMIDDVVTLMKKWEINNISDEISSKKIFFDYYIQRYGLKENELHCCPYCGGKIIHGIYNCPNCFLPILKDPMETTLSENRDFQVGNSIAEKSGLDYLDPRKLKLADTIKTISDTNQELIRENERLRSELEGKDVAIQAMRNYISDIAQTNEGSCKILIIGDVTIDTQEIKEIADEIGLPFNMIDILGEYSKIKKIAGRIRKDNKYAGIIIGAVPHKVEKLGNATSLSTLFKGAGFPYCIEAKTYQGELKITRESLKRALIDMTYHLNSQGLIKFGGNL